MSKYTSGADMWQDHKARHGAEEAWSICNRYLDMQINNGDPNELQFCYELYTAMQEDRLLSQDKTFEYGGVHFIPERQFRKDEGDFHTISRRAFSDHSLGLSIYEWQKAEYSYEGFYAASSDKECDLFRCVETGHLYYPGENELFGYHEPRQRKRSQKESIVEALEKAKPKEATQGVEEQHTQKRQGKIEREEP